jgi:hypothetical protein
MKNGRSACLQHKKVAAPASSQYQIKAPLMSTDDALKDI